MNIEKWKQADRRKNYRQEEISDGQKVMYSDRMKVVWQVK